MRLRQSLILLPALQLLARFTVAEIDGKQVARAAAPAYNNAVPDPSPTATPPGAVKGTKDAPVDGFDGKPHAGPYIDDTPTSHDKKPAVVEDLGTGKKTVAGSKDSTLVGAEAKVLDGDKSVMQDPDRKLATGKTGVEGGVSAKDKERLAHEDKTGSKKEQVPTSPKEAPPPPHGEQSHLKEAAATEIISTRVYGAVGLEKPTDLPDTPHDDAPHPVPDSLSKADPLDTTPKSKTPASSPPDEEAGGVIQPFHSFVLSFTMIIFSEIGDKTFLVAALMAMRHPRLVVFSAAFSALAVMTVLSAVLGHAVPAFLSERFTHLAAAILFLVFGVKLLREGLAMSPDDGVGEEMREVEEELEEKEQLARSKGRRRSSISPYALESGRARRSRSSSRLPAPARSPSTSPDRSPSPRGSSFTGALNGINNLFSLLLSPAWVQTFVMTFLGEWGDRSQIATVAMAAGSDYWWVTAGATVGHGICTAGAVIGGRAIAGKISMRNVTLGGAIAFLLFGIIYAFETYYHE
ncbi:GCR1-dependent translation factor 1 [Ascochyta rabiei]|uniref:Integral component of membrane n=1 Tax=Didymella rabiei TaxID=5454 RepID=A0A163BTE3_DIDRA|nr:GCR1-dependent translation factor 1 [Ascochyta rabiei]KZM21972.1 integral component of membrane [Ascochyta rabiei]UPX14594.1 GCR1-dependent translation factor 1 [Ascochyta rabiei]